MEHKGWEATQTGRRAEQAWKVSGPLPEAPAAVLSRPWWKGAQRTKPQCPHRGCWCPGPGGAQCREEQVWGRGAGELGAEALAGLSVVAAREQVTWASSGHL